MGEIKWSGDQQKVIDSRGENLLVSAAAGSGKTAVLTERIIRLIMDPAADTDIDKMLVVTFTNAAAAEMRERIGDKIQERIDADPMDRRLQRQQMLLHNASIVTMDSFCLNLIREYFHCIDIDPGFRIGDNPELKMLETETMDELLEDRYAEGSTEFFAFIDGYCSSRDDSSAETLIKTLYRAAAAQPDPEGWLEALRAESLPRSAEDVEASANMLFAIDFANKSIENLIAKAQKALDLTRMPKGPFKYDEKVFADINLMQTLLDAKTYSDKQAVVDGWKWQRIVGHNAKSDKPGCDLELLERFEVLHEGYKSYYKDHIKPLFALTLDDIIEENNQLAVPLGMLIDLTEDYMARLLQRKNEKNVFGFNDIEHYALQVLVRKDENGEFVRTPQAVMLAERYRDIFVDEYQDNNGIQEAIVGAIAGNPADRPYTFMVGDVKQSIYKFRMAKPELFLARFKRYSEDPAEGRDIVLRENFRSRPEVLSSTNDIFYALMQESIGGITYDADAALYEGTPHSHDEPFDYKTELTIIEYDRNRFIEATTSPDFFAECGPDASASGQMGSTDKPETDISTESSADTTGEDEDTYYNDGEDEGGIYEFAPEAEWVARRITQLMASDFKVETKDKVGRKLRYGDIAILFRSVKKHLDKYSTAFAKYGIPFASESSAGFLDTYEIRTVLDFLRILDNPRQDVPLVSVLHSSMFGFTADELAQIRVGAPSDVPMYEAVLMAEKRACKVNSNISNELDRKVGLFTEVFSEIRSMNMTRDIDRLVEAIIYRTGFYEYVAALPGGERRMSNLNSLLKYAAAFEAGSGTGLFSFMKYIEDLIGADSDIEEASGMGDENAVRLMTIHKSKGLEFPVVFIGGMSNLLRSEDAKSKIICSSEFGLGATIVDTERRTKKDSFSRKCVAKRLKLDMLGEEMRLLYVAMTRARQKLIMVGTVKDQGKRDGKWKNALKTQNTEGGTSVLYNYDYIFGATDYFDLVCPKAEYDEEHFIIRRVKSEQLYRQVLQSIDGAGAAEKGEAEKGKAGDDTCTDDTAGIGTASEDGSDVRLITPGMKRQGYRELVSGRSGAEEIPFLSFSYPDTHENILPMKMTVSELKRKASDDEDFGAPELVKSVDAEGELKREETVTELTREEMAVDVSKMMSAGGSEDAITQSAAGKVPAHNGARTMTGAEIGTLYHKIMQFVPFDLCEGMTEKAAFAAVVEFLNGLILRDVITTDERRAIRAERIVKFLMCGIARRMAAADKAGRLKREQPFVMGVRACDIDPSAYAGITDLIPVQGVIDCMFEEDGEYVIIDYKTDHVLPRKDGQGEEHNAVPEEGSEDVPGKEHNVAHAEELEAAKNELIRRYHAQLEYYAQAVTRIMGKSVKTKLIYSLQLGELIEL